MISFLNANPKNSKWFNRDRFVLSNGFVFEKSFKWHPFTFFFPTDTRKPNFFLLTWWRSFPTWSLTSQVRCALQYVLLHLLGYELTLDDLKAFRQVDSKTPGHPEAGHTDGNFATSLLRCHEFHVLCIRYWSHNGSTRSRLCKRRRTGYRTGSPCCSVQQRWFRSYQQLHLRYFYCVIDIDISFLILRFFSFHWRWVPYGRCC